MDSLGKVSSVDYTETTELLAGEDYRLCMHFSVNNISLLHSS